MPKLRFALKRLFAPIWFRRYPVDLGCIAPFPTSESILPSQWDLLDAVLNAILTTSAGKTVSGGTVDGEESEES